MLNPEIKRQAVNLVRYLEISFNLILIGKGEDSKVQCRIVYGTLEVSEAMDESRLAAKEGRWKED